ncbi:MAG: PEGA domain-containing protein [bacterium]
MRAQRTWIVLATTATLCLAAGPWAHAQPASRPATPPTSPPARPGAKTPTTGTTSRPLAKKAPKPWEKGVSEENRAKARALHQQGNKRFSEEKFADALSFYQRAVRFWDHPGIRFNMVECLVNLGRNVEAWQHLKAAMRYKEKGLAPRHYRQARTYRNMLWRSLARISVVCRETDAKVTLDGKPVFTAPGSITRLVTPGTHAVVAAKPGFITVAQQPNLPAGKLTTINIKLMPRTHERVMKRRWKQRWMPWTVLGIGIAVAAAALPLYFSAKKDFNDFSTRFAALCNDKPSGGCVPADLDATERAEWNALQDLESGAYRKYHASISLLGIGAAAAVAGAVLVILNQPRAIERSSPDTKLRFGGITPSVGPDGASVSLRLEF